MIKCPLCGKLVSPRFSMNDCQKGKRVLPEVGQVWKLTNGMNYRITRVTKKYLWWKWTAFGESRRDLSHRVPLSDFDARKLFLVGP